MCLKANKASGTEPRAVASGIRTQAEIWICSVICLTKTNSPPCLNLVESLSRSLPRAVLYPLGPLCGKAAEPAKLCAALVLISNLPEGRRPSAHQTAQPYCRNCSLPTAHYCGFVSSTRLKTVVLVPCFTDRLAARPPSIFTITTKPSNASGRKFVLSIAIRANGC